MFREKLRELGQHIKDRVIEPRLSQGDVYVAGKNGDIFAIEARRAGVIFAPRATYASEEVASEFIRGLKRTDGKPSFIKGPNLNPSAYKVGVLTYQEKPGVVMLWEFARSEVKHV